ncbi:carboxylesterase [Niveispirillum lacus]|uniref:Carboxylic ester hydrolase n=1 Tax=Niveispirillum lacus TaxID=1981099 RepID=A0A255YRZ1_9PROT|nr:carboxylesterase family protein [Niveispirillum lacus]OYQ31494.1 carboxylesterase [Niveispirillum lacus]
MNARALFLLFVMLAVPGSFAADGPLVRTEAGTVRGLSADGVDRFLGIPFAAPPVGDLRWRPPAPAATWTGERPAFTYGADCAQKPFIRDDAPLATQPSEDCLFLNVWRPAQRAGEKLPVMVWIHGGGYVNGGTSPAIYDGSRLALDGVVVVSANHRLGRLGFFAHPALTAEAAGGATANFGFMDQIAALRWVATNIASFGGDPANVTIFGESAGGESVNILLSSPPAQGLFHKAIAMSGGGRSTLLPTPTLAVGENAGHRFAARQGITDTGPAALSALRALPVDIVVGTLNLASLSAADDYSGPVIDGQLMPAEPIDQFRAGKAAKIPVMLGATSADGWYSGGSKENILAAFGPLAAEATRLYDPTGQDSALQVGQRVNGDAMFIEPARATGRALAAQGQPVYLYRFSYVAQNRRGIWTGTPHAKELPFVFDRVLARYGTAATPADLTMAARLRSYWTGFARTGVPAAPDGPAAPRLTADDERIIDFTNDGPRITIDPLRDRLDLVERWLDGK